MDSIFSCYFLYFYRSVYNITGFTLFKVLFKKLLLLRNVHHMRYCCGTLLIETRAFKWLLYLLFLMFQNIFICTFFMYIYAEYDMSQKFKHLYIVGLCNQKITNHKSLFFAYMGSCYTLHFELVSWSKAYVNCKTGKLKKPS